MKFNQLIEENSQPFIQRLKIISISIKPLQGVYEYVLKLQLKEHHRKRLRMKLEFQSSAIKCQGTPFCTAEHFSEVSGTD